MSPSPAAIAAWRGARSFAELCELGARFVEGRLDLFPGWGAAEIDGESQALVPRLARLNRAGWLTLASQPGALGLAAGGAEDRQRAFVFGFVTDELARVLREGPDGGEIVIRVLAPGERAGLAIEVSEHAGHACVSVGEPAFEEEWELFADCCGPQAQAELRERSFACAVDLEWGREDHLWRELAGRLDRAGLALDRAPEADPATASGPRPAGSASAAPSAPAPATDRA